MLREICASGIIMQPSENDLASAEIRPHLDRYMRGKDVDVEYKSRFSGLAHDLAASSFGLRQEIYERWHGGDPYAASTKELLQRPLPHGGVP